MTMPSRADIRVAIVWRHGGELRDVSAASCATIAQLTASLHAHGMTVVTVAYREEDAALVRQALADADGVLVCVNPLQDGRDRRGLDNLLREVADRGSWVSAHPDVCDTIGTKEVVFRARIARWDADTHIYRTPEDVRRYLPSRLAHHAARVLKQNRGNNGIGVWKVESVHDDSPLATSLIRVEQAHAPGAVEEIPLADLVDRLRGEFRLGPIIDQEYQRVSADGLVRAYFVGDGLVGFCRQQPRGLLQSPPADTPALSGPPAFLMEHPDAAGYDELRDGLESAWLPEFQSIVQLDASRLPAIWDADFLYGEDGPDAERRFVLCEINANAVWPFPEWACATIAQTVSDRLMTRGAARGDHVRSRS